MFGGRIARIGEPGEATTRLDAHGSYAVPGLIDAHMHVESTMLMPSEFSRLASAHGTTGAVLDPHEIANVLGLPGIRMLMDDARGAPLRAVWMASSCVPASHMETSGATLSAGDIAELLADPRVCGLAEMMNFPGVVAGDPAVLEKIRLGLEAGPVDGHAPGLMGAGLDAYAAAGIRSDHECTTAEQALERVRRGMRVFLREGSAARNLEALLPAVTPETLARFCLCTDDRHPGDLAGEGHIDHVVRKAIRLGLDPIDTLAMATINPAEHYGLHDMGAIAPGRLADLLLVDSLERFEARAVFFGGEIVAENGRCVTPETRSASSPANTVKLPDGFGIDSLAVPTSSTAPHIRVIGMDPHQLLTGHGRAEARVEAGRIVADPSRDMLKLAVIERHRGSGNIGLGFVTGFGIREGALASTIGHDSHNLAVVGADDQSMVAAARALAECGGGLAVAAGGVVRAVLPLPVAGLISTESSAVVIARQRELLEAAHGIGCPIEDPFMPLSFLPLVVIPSLKLSDRGLVDVDRFEIVPLEIENAGSRRA